MFDRLADPIKQKGKRENSQRNYFGKGGEKNWTVRLCFLLDEKEKGDASLQQTSFLRGLSST